MFKQLLDSLDVQEKDSLDDRINKEAISNKYWIALGGSLALLFLTVVLSLFTMLTRGEVLPTPIISVEVKNQQVNESTAQLLPYTLPEPQLSFKNVSRWLQIAVGEIYTFSFVNMDEQLLNAKQYFTEKGYQTYRDALTAKGIETDVKERNLEVSLIPAGAPVMINGNTVGGTEFWRFVVPTILSVYGGKTTVIENYQVEVLIVKVPSYVNHKGIAIAEFNIQ